MALRWTETILGFATIAGAIASPGCLSATINNSNSIAPSDLRTGNSNAAASVSAARCQRQMFMTALSLVVGGYLPFASALGFSASGSLHVLREAGIRDFFADLRGLGPAEIAEVLSALSADRAIPGASTFNLLRRNF